MPACHPRQLKALRRLPVPAAVLAAGRRRLLAVIAEAPPVFDARPRRLFFALSWKPAGAVLMVGAFMLMGAGTVLASQGSLPGDRLYSVKLAAEKARERVALFPSSRFLIQAKHANRHLEEAEKLLASSQKKTDAQQANGLRAALGAYEERVFDLDAAAVQWSVHPPRKESRMVQAAERVLDRHAAFIASFQTVQPGLVDVLLEPVDATLDFQNTMLSAARYSDASEHARLEQLHRSREAGMQARLQTLREQLHVPQQVETLSKS